MSLFTEIEELSDGIATAESVIDSEGFVWFRIEIKGDRSVYEIKHLAELVDRLAGFLPPDNLTRKIWQAMKCDSCGKELPEKCESSCDYNGTLSGLDYC